MARKFVAASSQKIVFSTTPITTTPLTISAWWNPVSSAVAQNIVTLSDGSVNNTFRLEQDGSGHCIANITAGGALSTATTSTALSSGTWNHMCVSFTNATARAAYLNGGGKGTNATSRSPAASSQIDIGTAFVEAFANGNIAEVAMWNIALADADVAELALGMAPWFVRADALVFYTSLLEGFSPEIDRMSTRTGTVTGATLIDGPPIVRSQRVQV